MKGSQKIVHVGQMKSGTTFIQNSLSQNRSQLERAKILYPGEKINQQHACYGLCGSDIYWVKNSLRWKPLGESLIRDIESHAGDTIISAEALSCMNETGIERFARTIGGIDEVIITVRSLPSTIISAWQQSVKRGDQSALPEFLDKLKRTRKGGGGLWRNYSFGNTAEWWSRYAKVSLIVVESFDRDDLIDVFLEAAGLPRVEFVQKPLSPEQQNISLKWEDVEVLRRINRYIDEKLSSDEGQEYRRFLLENALFPAAREGGAGSKIGFPANYVDWAHTWASEELEKIPSSTAIYGRIDLLKSFAFVEITDSVLPDVDIVERMNHLLHLCSKLFR